MSNNNSKTKFTIAVLNPGHFHAALSLRVSHPNISEDVHVYASEGPDLETFKNFIHDFNHRAENPTSWKLNVHTKGDPVETLIADKKADIVILAGKNNVKLQHIDAVNKAGMYIFSDKPLLTDEQDLPALNSAFSKDRPLSLDIMTERFEIGTILQKMFIAEPEIFGELALSDDGSPTIFKESVHHLYKTVNGKPLKRPEWYFDTNIQGEGIVDVMTHLIDMSNWMTLPNEALRFEKDFEINEARRWATPVSLEKYNTITGGTSFPESVKDFVDNNVLNLFCNGEIVYTLRGIKIHLKVIWDLEPPEGGGDTHYSRVRGTLADLVVRQIPRSGFKPEFLVCPHKNSPEFKAKLQSTIDSWQSKVSGLSISAEEGNYIINIPDALRTTHEQHFCEVRDMFLDWLVQNKEPANSRKNIIAKYSLMAAAKKMALLAPPEPIKPQLEMKGV